MQLLGCHKLNYGLGQMGINGGRERDRVVLVSSTPHSNERITITAGMVMCDRPSAVTHSHTSARDGAM